MQRPQLLENNKTPYHRQLMVARIVLFVFTGLFTVGAVEDLVYQDYLQWGIGVEYVHLKISLLALTLCVLSFSFVNARFRHLLSRVNFLFNFALFYIVALTIYIEGFNLIDGFYLLSLTILTYFIYYEFREVFYYAIFTNASLLLLVLFPREGIDSMLNEWIYYFVLSVGLSVIKYFEYKETEEVINADVFYRKVFNAIRESILLLDPKTSQIQFYNTTADKIFNISKTDYLSLKNMITAESYKVFETAFKMIFEFKGVWEGELVLINKDKKEFIAKATVSYLKQGEEEMIFLKAVDITKSKYAEQRVRETLTDLQGKNAELEQTKLAVLNVLEDINVEKAKVLAEEQKLETILQSIAEGVVVIDADMKIYMFNNTFLNMLGLSATEVQGHKYMDVLKMVKEDTGQAEDKDIPEVFKTGKVMNNFNKTQLIKKNGDLMDVNETYAPIIENNKVVRVVAVFRDATEQRKVERMRSEFISIASHQLRTPLTAISWYLEMLMDPDTMGNMSDEQKGYINMVFESNKKMIYLVNELLDISRMESGKELQFIKSEGDIMEVVNDVLEEQKGLISQKSLKLNLDTEGRTSLMVNMDKEKIRQVFMNLVNNAIKYCRPEGEISISVRTQDDKLAVSVADNGIGIPKEQQGRIFEKFFRSDNAVKMQAQGTGLGLYVANQIIKNHGGVLNFSSDENKGSVFTFIIPLK
ncbi:MAG TPA: ATP-binding protein [Candidatus Dojkabacteria bacterium]|nr:ATP-binding protein [Candidatus Dojkabacteria bacterium]